MVNKSAAETMAFSCSFFRCPAWPMTRVAPFPPLIVTQWQTPTPTPRRQSSQLVTYEYKVMGRELGWRHYSRVLAFADRFLVVGVTSRRYEYLANTVRKVDKELSSIWRLFKIGKRLNLQKVLSGKRSLWRSKRSKLFFISLACRSFL